MGYDYNLDNSIVTTHCKGFALDSHFELVTAVDPDSTKRELFKKKYGKTACSSIEEAYKLHSQFDVVTIGTPTVHHFSNLKEIVKHKPKLILCEKPLGSTSAEALEMNKLCQEAGIKLLVNLKRRFDPGFIALKEKIESGVWGALCKGTGLYTKGLLNNGSHFIDLFFYLFNEVGPFQVLRSEKSQGYSIEDQDVDLALKIKGADFYLLCLDKRHAGLAEIELFFEKARVSINDGLTKIIIQEVTDSIQYAGLKTIDKPSVLETKMDRYQAFVTENIFDILKAHKKSLSTGEDSLKSLQIISQILQR